MTDAPVETGPWSRQRWWLAIACVLLLQAALIFLLERAAPGKPRPAALVPLIHLRERVSLEPLAISDPTLFVLPHQRGFSGEAWLNRPPVPGFQPADWTEPPRALALATERLGANFNEFITANTAPQLETLATFGPPRQQPALFQLASPPPPSSFRVEGGLAQRHLLAMPLLRAWESSELVSNSVVQVLVDAPGRIVSAVLLTPGSGATQRKADALALELARVAQFEPDAAAGLSLGTMIFEWQTLAVSATNVLGEVP